MHKPNEELSLMQFELTELVEDFLPLKIMDLKLIRLVNISALWVAEFFNNWLGVPHILTAWIFEMHIFSELVSDQIQVILAAGISLAKLARLFKQSIVGYVFIECQIIGSLQLSAGALMVEEPLVALFDWDVSSSLDFGTGHNFFAGSTIHECVPSDGIGVVLLEFFKGRVHQWAESISGVPTRPFLDYGDDWVIVAHTVR